MPYFLCPECALRAYSAAAEALCPRCDTPLGRSNQIHPSIPLAEPLRGRRFRSNPTGSRRFGSGTRDGLSRVGRQ